ncbi:MAG: MFS transporter, partial [Thermodesulfobacteriota bacterium]
MVGTLQKVFKVYPNEVRLLLWVSAMQLAMRISSVLINNYAQAAFLKRFGVEYLPAIFVIEAILTFFMANAVGVLMGRFRTIRVFTGLLLFFALAVATIRGLLPLNIAILYPILFILKSQAIETLPILYWDILNDLFTTRQSKRLFTLITAGGILGTTVGSIMTGTVAKWVGIDNVLLIFVGGTLIAALLNENTERVVGSPLEPAPETRRLAKRKPLRETVREAYEYSKLSPFLKYMIVLVAIPNVVLPVLTYQFNVIVDMTYATERDTLQFLGVFRGISNAVIFGILLFSGRLVNKWGVATSLLI